MTKWNIPEILNQHSLWLKGQGGKQADLSGANLIGVDLSGVDLRGANLRGANLSGAYLRGDNLSEANLRVANLWDCIGNNAEVRNIMLGTYIVTTHGDRIQIGCKNYSISEWESFDDDYITKMSSGALGWWRAHKYTVIAFAKREL